MMSVLSYTENPTLQGTPEKNVTLYGPRVENIYKERGVTLKRDESGQISVPLSKL